MIPMLWENNHAAWFLMRSLSLTSSTVHNLIHYLKRVGDNVREEIGIPSMEWDILAHYLATDGDSVDHDGIHNHDQASSLEEDFEVSVALLQNDEELVSRLKDSFDAKELSEEQVRAYVHHFKGKSTGPIARVEEELGKWLAASQERRPYILQQLRVLKDEASFTIEGWSSKTSDGSSRRREKKIEEVIDDLVARDIRDGNRTSLEQLETAKINLFKRLIQSSYMAKLSTKERDYTRRGHDLERPFARKIFEECQSKNYNGSPTLHGIFENGMVCRNQMSWVKDSNDFLAVQEDMEGDLVVLPLEMKARLAAHRVQQEEETRDNAQGLVDGLLAEMSETRESSKYKSIGSGSQQLMRYIPDARERMQMLHHSFTHQCNQCMLVVGDTHGEIIWTIKVEFEQSTLNSYKKVVDALYGFLLQDFYREPARLPQDPCLHYAIRSLKIDVAALEQMFKVWHSVVTKLKMPLPPVIRIVPMWVATWNAIKSGSDTMTKLLDSVPARIPARSAQSVVVSRLSFLLSIVGFRTYQMCTARWEVSKYTSLATYRRAASNRMTFETYVNSLAASLNRLAMGMKSERRIQIETVSDVSQLFASPLNLAAMSQASSISTSSSIRGRGLPLSHRDRTTRSNAHYTHVEGLHDQSSLTPQKRQAEQMERGHLMAARDESCVGILVKRDNPDLVLQAGSAARAGSTTRNDTNGSRGSCVICKARVQTYCLGCHQYFCVKVSTKRKGMTKEQMERANAVDLDKEYLDLGPDMRRKNTEGEPRRVVVENSCFVARHRQKMSEACKSLSEVTMGAIGIESQQLFPA